jgi:hypothetical protein
MNDRFALELPDDLSDAERDELVASLRDVEGVERAEVLGTRSIDLGTISVGVQLAAQVQDLLGPVVEKIVNVVRGRQIKGVKIAFPGGMSLAVDEISGKDLKQLLEQIAAVK